MPAMTRPPTRRRLPLVLLLVALAVALAAPSAAPTSASRPAGAEQDGTGTWPLSPRPRVVDGFSPPADRFGRGHRGVDLAGRPAQPVVSALPGEVSFAGTIAGRGVVVVSHGPTRTTYEPVLADVAPGQQVGAGMRLGWLHTTGSHCAPAACLHWGWRHGDAYLDPLTLVGGAGVRLLPLWSLPGPLPLPPQARGWAWE